MQWDCRGKAYEHTSTHTQKHHAHSKPKTNWENIWKSGHTYLLSYTSFISHLTAHSVRHISDFIFILRWIWHSERFDGKQVRAASDHRAHEDRDKWRTPNLATVDTVCCVFFFFVSFVLLCCVCYFRVHYTWLSPRYSCSVAPLLITWNISGPLNVSGRVYLCLCHSLMSRHIWVNAGRIA